MTIELVVEEGVATVLLNRPDKKNAMLLAMRDQLATLCEMINDDSRIRAVILTGAGSDFCAGADISEMGTAGIDGSLLRARHMYKAITAINAVQKPVIGAIKGVAVGMGLSLALACDYILVSPTLKMGCVQRKIGLCPDAGNIWFLSRQVGAAKAKELVFSARMFGADEALALGVASEIVPDEKILARARELSLSFASAPTYRVNFTGGLQSIARGTMDTLTVVPLPTAMILFGLGFIALVGIGAGSWRQRKTDSLRPKDKVFITQLASKR